MKTSGDAELHPLIQTVLRESDESSLPTHEVTQVFRVTLSNTEVMAKMYHIEDASDFLWIRSHNKCFGFEDGEGQDEQRDDELRPPHCPSGCHPSPPRRKPSLPRRLPRSY